MNKLLKDQDSKKVSTSPKSQSSKKQSRKRGNPTRIPTITEAGSGSECSSTWICKNSACRAMLSIFDTFCKRCSCCICHLFDENKDPSLWLECTSDSPAHSCGLSCHIECALQRGKVGVLGQALQLDGSYWCASCGEFSGILGFWKKQLTIAKDSRRVDSFCYRIYLSFRLFEGTLRFQDLHEIVKDAKAKLETEVGPLNGVFAKMARGIVSRLSVAEDVLALCNAAIQKADEVSATLPSSSLDGKEGSVPAVSKFIFEEITSSSVVLVLTESPSSSSSDVIGFKLWYSKTREETHKKYPISTFPRSQRRILISNLQPCTEYSFRIVPYTKTGDLGRSEAKCFTESVETLHKNLGDLMVTQNGVTGANDVRNVGKILQLTWVDEQGHLDDISGPDMSKLGQMVNANPSKADGLPYSSHGLDLNIALVPDMNEDVAPLSDYSKDGADHGDGGSENWAQRGPNGDVPAVDSRAVVLGKRPACAEAHDCDGALMISPFSAQGPSNLDGNFEYCVEMIRWLECQGYITEEFRLKLLTWFSVRSTEQERRVVNIFIQTFGDDLVSLAGQLVDTFSDIINNKRPRN